MLCSNCLFTFIFVFCCTVCNTLLVIFATQRQHIFAHCVKNQENVHFLIENSQFFENVHLVETVGNKWVKKNMETASKSGSIAVNLKHLIAYSDAVYGVLPNRYGETVLTKDSLLVMAGCIAHMEKTGPVLTIHLAPTGDVSMGRSSFIIVIVSSFKAMLQWTVGNYVKIVGAWFFCNFGLSILWHYNNIGKLELAAAPVMCESVDGSWRSIQPIVVQSTRKHLGFHDTEEGKAICTSRKISSYQIFHIFKQSTSHQWES